MIAACGAAAGLSVHAEVRCADIFGDHMVLQRDHAVAVWGSANPGEKITVEFAQHRAATDATADGTWRVDLPAMSASTSPQTLTVSGENTVTFADVLVGEVWLCSGQSNMEKPFGERKGQKPTDDSTAEIAAATCPTLRLYQVPHHGRSAREQSTHELRWLPSSPTNLTESHFSAAAYVFGRELQRELQVPVGLIHASFGGTQIEAWMPERAFENDAALAALRHTRYFAWVDGVQATELFRSMISPLVPFTLRGWLWYQGEANCMQADAGIYTTKLRALIESWRAAWALPEAPFYYALIAPFNYSHWESFPKTLTPEALPIFWEAQIAALDAPYTGIVSTTDLAGTARDIHPTNKRDVGVRFARLALANTYGRELLAESPRFYASHPRPNGRVAVEFSEVGTGLRSRNGAPLTEFAIAGDDHVFHPASGDVSGSTVMLHAPEVTHPVAVRFCWHETANPNLVNSAGLPALPFRTDDWPVLTERPKRPAKK